MDPQVFDISGKLVLVTGSTQGLGRTLAEGMGKAGARIVVNGRAESKVDQTVEELERAGIEALGSAFDITREEEVNEAVSRIRTEHGAVDVLVNNAGLQIRNPLESFALEDWTRVLAVNMTGAFLTAKAVVPDMIARRGGKIINICSLMSELARNTIAPYTAAKGGLKNLTKGMATDWGKHNIQVNGIGPGYFATEMTRPLWEDPEFSNWLCQRTPANRWGKPEELVGPTIFLASAASDYVNGHILYVDGGMLACV